ncbi:MAG: OsmC family protein [Paracoccaceae bacterium]
MSEDPDLLPPGIDPAKSAIGIRRVSARNEAATRTVMKVRDHVLVTDEKETDTGPSPLETALAALLGCEGVIINRCASAMKFAYTGVDMEADGEVDRRGSRGVAGVRPYFNWVRLRIRIHTAEPDERLARLAKNVELRCPVMNLFRSAGVAVEVAWERVPP